ncbi:hypothetical protein HanRHA438_Chr04g0173391 [Helianthus annuus]|nr:hypothetical protein HanRHA438_Chr04g0173391 [Helianthus annuus]
MVIYVLCQVLHAQLSLNMLLNQITCQKYVHIVKLRILASKGHFGHLLWAYKLTSK